MSSYCFCFHLFYHESPPPPPPPAYLPPSPSQLDIFTSQILISITSTETSLASLKAALLLPAPLYLFCFTLSFVQPDEVMFKPFLFGTLCDTSPNRGEPNLCSHMRSRSSGACFHTLLLGLCLHRCVYMCES